MKKIKAVSSWFINIISLQSIYVRNYMKLYKLWKLNKIKNYWLHVYFGKFEQHSEVNYILKGNYDTYDHYSSILYFKNKLICVLKCRAKSWYC